jgi:hypothetical protein
MRKKQWGQAIAVCAFLICATGGVLVSEAGQEKAAAPAAKKTLAAPAAFIGTPDKLTWGALVPGVEEAVVYGNCDKPGAPCVFQLRFADGAKIAPHWHPVDENVTVLSGTLVAGMGDTIDEAKAAAMPAGSYVFMPKKMHHYALAKGPTVVQVHGLGPFKVMWVHPEDDPAKAKK